MGKRGPAPKPTALKKLQGNPGRKPLNDAEPQPHIGTRTPSVPAWLDEDAQAIWKRYARTLWELRLLTEIDVPAFAMLCESLALYQTAGERIRRGFHVQVTESGYRQQDPWVSIRNNAFAQVKQMMQEFGMTPSARSGIKLELEEKQKTLVEELFEAINQE